MSEQWDGRPQNPERDGWHLIRTDDGVEYVVRWSVARGWLDGELVIYAAESIYGGPLLLPAEIAAREEAARREALDEAAEVCKKRARAWEDSCYSLALSWRDEAECCAAAIRARGDA
jgi:hypothetical protein